MESRIDLHSHSTVSDGVLTPRQLVEHAASRGVKVLALTDHDSVAGLLEADEIARQHGLHLIKGVEISTTWQQHSIHIVGLKIAPGYLPLVRGLARNRAGRYERAEKIAYSLAQVGISGSLEGAMQYTHRDMIGRTHFARFLVAHGHAKNVPAVFRRYLIKGKPGYASHIWADMGDAIAWITGSGGVAILAHPGRYKIGNTRLLELLADFRHMGGTAIEVVSSSHTRDQCELFARLAHQFGFLSSVGSDYHGHGGNYGEIGRLPVLPPICKAVWRDWPEMT